jgi:hypothetical protein
MPKTTPSYPKACAYCGSRENLTDDHVPPRNVFPKPRPGNLITVPACEKCNKSTSKDEEYFRLKLCLSEQVGNNPDARRNREAIFRSLERPEATLFKRSFLSDMRSIQLRTPAGIYLGRRLAFDVDLSRIFRVVEKSIKGLFFYETGHRLHPLYEVDIQSNETLNEYPLEVLKEWKQTILLPLAHLSPKTIGEGIFAYRFHITEEDPFVSAWLLTFYEQVSFLGLTGPMREKEMKGT